MTISALPCVMCHCPCVIARVSLLNKQRAKKENAKIKEQIEKQRLAKEREVRCMLMQVCSVACKHPFSSPGESKAGEEQKRYSQAEHKGLGLEQRSR